MKITFLGTGTSQGVPVIACPCIVCSSVDPKDKRLRTSILVETQNTTLIVDTGPDFREQMLREKVQNLDAVLYTHTHRDHTAGMDDVRAFNYVQQKAMEVYCTKPSLDVLETQFDYVFAAHKYPGIPKINVNIIDSSPFEINELEVIPINVMHYKMPVLGFRFGDFTYITDANFIPGAEKDKIRGTKVLILNALRREKHISHFTLEQSLEVIREFQPEKAYLIHMSHQMGLHKEVSLELPENVSLAFDGLKITL